MKQSYLRAHKLAKKSGISMPALRLILNKPNLNPNEKISLK